MKMQELEKAVRHYTKGFLEFLRNSGSSFVATKNLKEKLKKNGANVLYDESIWDLKRNEAYVTCPQNRCVFSFFVGKDFDLDSGSIIITVGHVDSPCLKVTPNNHLIQNKLFQLNVECYGGGLWNTWFDRGLGISGMVLYKKGEQVIEKTVQINKPLFIVPSLAIHLQNLNEYPIKVDNEKHLKPIGATAFMHELMHNKKGKNEDEDKNKVEKKVHSTESEGSPNRVKDELNNSPLLLHVLKEELKCKEEDILDFELCLFDTADPALCGVYEEFLASGRLDNLGGTFGIFEAFIEFVNDIRKDTSTSKKHKNLYICIGFDHEEIGSETEVGGKANLTKDYINRIISSLFKEELKKYTVQEIYGKLIAKSMLVSVDMAHCAHPNYPDHAQPQHKVAFQEGIVIKSNINKRYTTAPYNARLLRTTFHLHEKYNKEQIKCQYFIVKNTMRCGTTVGPMLSANLSIRGVDIGIPQLAMHSAREIMSIFDLYYLIKGIQAFYTYYQDAQELYHHEEAN